MRAHPGRDARSSSSGRIEDQVLLESECLYDFSFLEQDGPSPPLWPDPTYGMEHADVVLQTMSDTRSAKIYGWEVVGAGQPSAHEDPRPR